VLCKHKLFGAVWFFSEGTCNLQWGKLRNKDLKENLVPSLWWQTKKTNCMVWVRERTIPTERPTFADKGCHVVSVTDPYGRILGFLDRRRYFSIKQLLSWTHEAEWTPFQTHYVFSGSAGNRTRASGSVTKNPDHYTTEAVSLRWQQYQVSS
jgi:hypothetical protein